MRDTEEQVREPAAAAVRQQEKEGWRQLRNGAAKGRRHGAATAPVSVPAAWDGEGVWMCGMGRRQHMCTRVSSALRAA